MSQRITSPKPLETPRQLAKRYTQRIEAGRYMKNHIFFSRYAPHTNPPEIESFPSSTHRYRERTAHPYEDSQSIAHYANGYAMKNCPKKNSTSWWGFHWSIACSAT
jgi:hypothetical protein